MFVFFQNKQKLRGSKISKRELLGEGVTRPLADLGVPEDYAKSHTPLETLRKMTDPRISLLENNNYQVIPSEMPNGWEAADAGYSYAVNQPPVARATTPTLMGEPQEHYYTQVLSSMDIPTFEDTLKPLSSSVMR